ncbi:MAG: hypothetical protein JST50_02940 [Bacteroidetes bacterium]|jgi:hypothetical protein|nr:hypothetical protein [Bacteroidota bacterium]
MGSSGSGSLTDYSNNKPTSSNPSSGGSSGQDNCGQAFEAVLEDVSRCDYYKMNNDVPPVGTNVKVIFNNIRLLVTTSDGTGVGYLPTKFNYIKVCIDNGFNYAGVVTASSIKPMPYVKVDIAPL